MVRMFEETKEETNMLIYKMVSELKDHLNK